MTPNPYDQADGFYGGDEEEDEGFGAWAEREAAGTYNDTWRLLYDLQKSAEKKNWDEMRRDIAAFKGDIPFQDLSLKAFRLAAAAGQLDIVKTMFDRKFRLMTEDGAAALEDLARHPDSKPVIAYLLANKYAEPDQALSTVEAEGDPDMMEVFRKAGCDILRSGRAISHALHNGNVDMMQYLYKHGADIYRPSIVEGLYGGIESYQASNRDRVVSFNTAHIKQSFRALVEDDAKKWEYYYAIHVPPHPSLDDFRAVPPGVASKDMTLLQIAARAGCFADVMEAAARETKNPLTAEDMLRTDVSGASVLTVLATRMETAQAFDVRLWFRQPEEAAKLHEGLYSLGADVAIDPAAYAADLQRYRLKALAKTANVSLKPRPPRA
ncbi:MAG: hypothetical protein EPN97_01970 [Alphaproteobacteria bacterium]|nr:MAG: hypothetical protein EPN97_01970 [Alphaproteobacteria bacterium]